jgi:hypothetical protein
MSLQRETDEQITYSLDEARKYLAHGNRKRAADELQFAAERATDARHVSSIRQLAISARDGSWRFGRGRWDRVLETLEQRASAQG